MDIDKYKLYQVYNKVDCICDRLCKVLNISSNNNDCTDNGDTLDYIANIRIAKFRYDNNVTIDMTQADNKGRDRVLNKFL